MRKKLTITFAILVVLIIALYVFLPHIVLNMVTEYEPYTFEMVLGDEEMRDDFGIQNNSSPEDYSFASEEINFQSFDGTRLNGWYIPAKMETNRCLILVHGRTSNRLKTLKYLALIDTLDLDTLYNIFIPDLRNSGKSQPSKTYMGYKFGEDVATSILLMDSLYHQNRFFLYGFSMGAMAILNATGRSDLIDKYADKNIIIEKLILDSPLVNVKETLREESKKSNIPGIIFNNVFELYSQEINGFGENMKISKLLDTDIPTLILQSRDDETTRISFLKQELAGMNNFGNFETVYFDGPDHVKMFQDERTNEKYINSVRSFISNSR